MAYEPSKDKLLFDVGTKSLNDGSTLEAGVYSYNGAAPKFRVIKRSKNGKWVNSVVNLDGEMFAEVEKMMKWVVDAGVFAPAPAKAA